MRRQSIVGFASFLTLSALFLSACGDNKSPSTGTGGVTDGGTPDGATGGLGGAGGGGGGTCSASFVAPVDGATLNVGSDPVVGACMTDGFHAKIQVATSQPDGTTATLSVGNATSGTAKVMGSVVTFSNVSLPQGSQTLKVSFSTTCSVSAKVTVDCNLPTCTINKPALTTVHPALNGVPAAQGGDRASADGAAYQVAFSVDTDIEDGQPVKLTVMRSAVLSQQTVLTATAMSGHAVFAGVPLSPDANYDVQAACTNKAGAIGYSASPAVYPVDTAPPDLTISSPANDAFMGPTALTNGAFKVCAKTTSPDATTVNLPAGIKNLCVAIGTAACANPTAVTATATDTCVDVPCPGSGPFDINVTLSDAAGNATKKTITHVTCASALPSVQIISPTTDNSTPAFSDPTKRLLAASSTNTLKDQVPATAGAQWTVAACANAAGSATLYGGLAGSTLTSVATVAAVAAVAADNCPAGYQYIVKFPSATLPESGEDGSGALGTATELRVDIKDVNNAVGSSPPVDLWVDSSAPTVIEAPGSALCGSTVQSATDVVRDVRLLTTSAGVTLTITPSAGTAQNYTSSSYAGSIATFSAVAFPLGSDVMSAAITEPSGNAGTLAQPCTILVGTPPIVTFTSPSTGKNLCASTTTGGTCIPDADGTMDGWQGAVSVNVTVGGAPATSGTVTFATNVGALGQATIGTNGVASLTGITIPDGVTSLTATTSEFTGNGTGTAVLNLVVDTIVPSAPTQLAAAIRDRRQTSYDLSFTAPADGTKAASSYDVRYSKSPIDATNFATAAKFAYTGAPKASGGSETLTVSNLYIETSYSFAVAALDAAGNQSPPTSVTLTPTQTAHFNVTVIKGPLDAGANAGFGVALDSSEDVTGDGLFDLLVAERAYHRVFLYQGSASFADIGPAKTFTATSGHLFGGGLAMVGDINGDGKQDLAIGAALDTPSSVYVYLGGSAKWSGSALTELNADAVITATGQTSALFGFPVARVGDLNGDGFGDIGVGLTGYNGGKGRVAIIWGRSDFTTVDLSDTTRVTYVDPPTGAPNSFGANLLGLGARNGALVVSAAGSTGGVYAFVYDGTTKAFMAVGTPIVGPTTTAQIGSSASLLTSNGALVIASPFLAPDTLSGRVTVFFGGTASNPFGAPSLVFQDSLTTGSLNNFGMLALGGGFSGSARQVSVIGASAPDLVLGSALEGTTAPRLYIFDGSKLPGTLSSPVDAATTADVIFSGFPADWSGTSPHNSIVPDINGDQYADIAIGEYKRTTGTPQGRVLVLW